MPDKSQEEATPVETMNNWLRCFLIAAELVLVGGMLMSAAAQAEPEMGQTLTVGYRERFEGIQEAVNAARPGDTVLVRGGVYRESVTFPVAGEPGRPITLRAMPGHIVLVTTSTPLTGGLTAVEGRPDVYRLNGSAPELNREGIGIWEASSHLRLVRVASLDECERRLGSWFLDPSDNALYVRCAGGVPPPAHEYLVEGVKPALEIAHPWIVLDGIQAAFSAHGVLIRGKATNVVVRNGRFFCNRSAGIHATGEYLLLEDNEIYRNNQYGIQLRYGVSRSTVRRNLCYYNGPNNGEETDSSVPTDLGLYGQGDYVVFEDNIVDGLHQCAFRTKTGHGPNDTTVVRRNVVRGFFDPSGSRCVENNTVLVNGVGSRYGFFPQRVNPRYNGDADAVDPGGEMRRANLFHPVFQKQDPLFADPAWRDFRLQGGSPYQGRGAYPGVALLLYIDPANGSDDNDGHSVSGALRTLDRACAALRPGYTLYLLPGTYEEPLQPSLGGLSEAEPLRIRAHGRSGDVVLTGGAEVKSVRHLAFEGLTFRGKGVTVIRSGDVRLEYCVFADLDTAVETDTVETLRLDHDTFCNVKCGVRLVGSRDIAVSNCLFAGPGESIVADALSIGQLYSDHNVFEAPGFTAAEQNVSLASWREQFGQDRNSRTMAVRLDEGFRPPADSPVRFAAADYTFAGARPACSIEALGIRNLRTVCAPTSVSLLWQTPGGATESCVAVKPVGGGSTLIVRPTTIFQVLGEYFDWTNRLGSFFRVDRHATVSGLEPGREYEAEVTALTPDLTVSHTRAIRFRLPEEAPAGRTLFISPEGNDAWDGATERTAWRTFAHAAENVAPGDRVVVLPGRYGEVLRPRISGTEDRPIVFESARVGAAVIDRMGSLPCAIEIANVDHVYVMGFKFAGGGGAGVCVINSRGVRVSKCQADYPPGMTFQRLRAGPSGLLATDAPGLVVENNIFVGNVIGIGVSTSPGARIVNNTILGEGNYGISIVVGEDGERYEVLNNILYRAIMGYKVGSQVYVMNARPDLRLDYNLYYIPADHKATIGKLRDTDRIRTLEEWQKVTGLDLHSLCAEPKFVDPENGDFRLAPGSPGSTMADDSGPVGARRP